MESERGEALQQVRQMSSQIASLEASLALVGSRDSGERALGAVSNSQVMEAFLLERERERTMLERERAERAERSERERVEREREREREREAKGKTNPDAGIRCLAREYD